MTPCFRPFSMAFALILLSGVASRAEAYIGVAGSLDIRADIVLVQDTIPGGTYQVLVGGFPTEAAAEGLKARLEDDFGIWPVEVTSENGTYKVEIGYRWPTRQEALAYLRSLEPLGIENLSVEVPGEAVTTPTQADQTRVISMHVNEALAADDFDRAAELIERWRELDPQNPAIDVALQAITSRRGEADSPAAQVREQARDAEQRGDLQEALRLWQDYRSEASGMAEEVLARDNITRLTREISAREVATPGTATTSSSSGDGGLLIWILAIGGVLIVAVAGFFVLSSRKQAAAPAPATSAAGTVRTRGAGAKSTLGAAGISSKRKPGEKKKAERREVSEEAPISPGAVLPSDPEAGGEDGQDEPAAAESPSSDRIVLDDLMTPAAPEADGSNGSGEPARTTPVPARAGKKTAREPAPVAAGPELDVFFEQDFEEEAPGSQPSNWEGDYSYASLTVEKRADGAGNCLVFEKGRGEGGAIYACQFRNAEGIVAVEVDIQCEYKNKYLLGFYLEKDGDFRQSIPMLIHKELGGGEQVSLRVQKESVPYSLGTWVRVKFVVDLPRSIVDWYVDGRQVAIGIRLHSRMNMLNTLSIRDNQGTEGLLRLDNIRVYQER